jgi:predicted nucleic acid-binding protein
MILVDTSVMINFFKGKNNDKVSKLIYLVNNKIPFGICNTVYLELLQGTKTEKEFNLLKEYLSTQVFYELKNGLASYEAAASNYRLCRKNGITIRSTIDLLIAQITIENDLLLLHDDNDFTALSKFIKGLKEY